METLDKIFEKLGIYDLVVILLFGLCANTITILLAGFFIGSEFINILKDYTFIFIVFSYLTGIIFQEITALIDRYVIHRNNRLLLKSLKTKSNHHLYMEPKELEDIKEYFKKELGLKDTDNIIIYNHCKSYIIQEGCTSKIDSNQTTGAFSRSFSFYCFLAGIACVVLAIIYGGVIWQQVVVIAVLFALAVLFYFRFLRFAQMRYIQVCRYFLNNVIYKTHGKD